MVVVPAVSILWLSVPIRGETCHDGTLQNVTGLISTLERTAPIVVLRRRRDERL